MNSKTKHFQYLQVPASMCITSHFVYQIGRQKQLIMHLSQTTKPVSQAGPYSKPVQ